MRLVFQVEPYSLCMAVPAFLHTPLSFFHYAFLFVPSLEFFVLLMVEGAEALYAPYAEPAQRLLFSDKQCVRFSS
jgi:hypothetical protein